MGTKTVEFAKSVAFLACWNVRISSRRHFNYHDPYRTITPEYLMKTLQERLQDEGLTPNIDFDDHVDIGLPSKKAANDRAARLEDRKLLKNNEEIKKLTLAKQYHPDMSGVRKEWESGVGKLHIREAAAHYGIYEHLFGPRAFFLPQVKLDVKYQLGEDVSPVYYGNIIKPKECVSAPEVRFDSSPDDLWTLVMTNPDGCFYDSNKECVHWLVANIRGGDVSTGEVICDYLPPFPPKGVGYQRVVYVLYKQQKKLDMSEYHITSDRKHDLPLRTFSTYDFYRKYEEDITRNLE